MRYVDTLGMEFLFQPSTANQMTRLGIDPSCERGGARRDPQTLPTLFTARRFRLPGPLAPFAPWPPLPYMLMLCCIA